MTEHTSAEFREILRAANWTEEDIENGETLAIAREVKALKKEGIQSGASASESGGVVGASGPGADAESLAAELERLQKLPATSETMVARKKIRKALDAASPMTVEYR